jgi:hypothetical protein
MNVDYWLKTLQSSDEIKKSQLLFEKINVKNIVNDDVYFEYLIIRLFASMDHFKKLQFSMKLDKNFEPVSVVGNKADLIASYDDVELIVEPTLRPISGKADHFSHITDSDKQLGLLVSRDITKIDPQIWNTYEVYSKKNGKLFMICDVPFLLKLLENQKSSNEKFLNFIKNSKEIWLSGSSWKDIREKIILLIT